MGACMKKPGAGNNVVERERRRLSVSKADEAPEKSQPDNTRGTVQTGKEGNILDLPYFHGAQKKVSICGAPSGDVQQKGFADKKTDTVVSGQPLGAEGEHLSALRVGCVCKKGLKPESPNQDDFCVFRVDTTGIYGVFDGHGPYGHDISGFVQEALPRCFVQDQLFKTDPEKALSTAFSEAHRLCTESQHDGHFDCTLSGTTATLAMHRDGNLYVAHVGDSRAVLAIRKGNSLESKDLTDDHKPTCETERRRITAKGGQVRRLEGDIPYRVFVSGKLYPGLAMTRSIGDTVGTAAGVTSTPEVKKLEVQKDWRFMLLCSDGIWEFISSQEAVNIISRYPPSEVQKATEDLASKAWNCWIKEEGNVVDDITVICTWFHED